jgi:hypothetical protein
VEENQPNPGRPAIRRDSEEISIVNLALALKSNRPRES